MQKLLLAITAVLAAALLTSASINRDTCLGSFSANMQFGGAQSGTSNGMKFDGKLAWAKPKLRLDLTEKMTKEAMVVLVDFASGDGTLLYPDTLNGFKAKLPTMESTGYLGYVMQFQHLLSTGGKQLPKGWTRTKIGSEKIGKTAVTKYKVSGPGGEQVYWWMDSSDRPLKVESAKGKTKITLDFGKMNFGAEVPSKTFAYGKEYTIMQMSPDQAKALVPKPKTH